MVSSCARQAATAVWLIVQAVHGLVGRVFGANVQPEQQQDGEEQDAAAEDDVQRDSGAVGHLRPGDAPVAPY